MVTIKQTPEEIKLSQEYKLGEKVAIHRELCDTAQRNLGTWINPSGLMTHPDGKVKSGWRRHKHGKIIFSTVTCPPRRSTWRTIVFFKQK